MVAVAARVKEREHESGPRVRCECGCGELTHQFDASGRERRYIKGHYMRALFASVRRDKVEKPRDSR